MITTFDQDNYKELISLGKLIKDDFDISTISSNDRVIVYRDKAGEIRGFLQYSVSYEVIDILNIAVSEDYRRMGIATAMIDHLIREEHPDRLMLEVKESNVVAIKFYEHIGFKTLRVIKNYYGIENAYAMERVVS